MKKIITVMCVLSLLLTSFVGCNNNKGNTLIVSVANFGYGVEWAQALKKSFEKKHDVKVKLNIVEAGNESTFHTQLLAGTTDVDLFFSRDSMTKYMYTSHSIKGKQYYRLLEDLSDLYASELPGENRTFADKMHPSILKYLGVEDNGKTKYYTVPWVSNVLGLLYNKNVWKSSWGELPVTTNEMLNITSKAIINDGYTPFVYSYEDPYWYCVQESWINQYEGIEAVDKFWDGYTPNGSRYEPEMMLYPGFEKAYEVLAQILDNEAEYVHPDSKDLSFTMAQHYILDADYKTAMQPNGDWIQREMSANYSADNVNVEFMKTPIISAIVEKLEYRNGGEYMSDELLRDVIRAIDSGETSFENVSDKDFARIKEARSVNITLSTGHVAYIPVYSDQKDLAKDFLRHMISDEGLIDFTVATGGSTQPYDFDYLGNETTSQIMSAFNKSSYNAFINSTLIPWERNINPLFSVGGLTLNYGFISYLESFTAPKTSEKYKTARQYYLYNYEAAKKDWNKIITLAGLSDY